MVTIAALEMLRKRSYHFFLNFVVVVVML